MKKIFNIFNIFRYFQKDSCNDYNNKSFLSFIIDDNKELFIRARVDEIDAKEYAQLLMLLTTPAMLDKILTILIKANPIVLEKVVQEMSDITQSSIQNIEHKMCQPVIKPTQVFSNDSNLPR